MEHAKDLPEGTPSFEGFGLDPRIVEALDAIGFSAPTPIQAQAMPPLLAGRDVIGRARTGSGKTAAFGLPLVNRVREGGDHVRALVLTPTRELALQVTEAIRSFATKLPVRVVTVYGGAAYEPQLKALRRGVPIVVGTPGRVLDHLDRGTLDLTKLELLVLDEADEMLRMGFVEDVERVLSASPDDRQVALFSASMPEAIQRIAEKQLTDPLEVQVEKSALTVDHIEQRALVVPERFKINALSRVLAAEPIESALVFARTRSGCARTADELARRGLAVDALHGDLSQAARERVLLRFRSGSLRIVIATDVAARGIDVDRISHVINFDLPNSPESYVHRIGRTGRAGREGVAISMVTGREVGRLRFFERTLKVKVERVTVPSDADIHRAERARLASDVGEMGTESAGVGELLEELAVDDVAEVARRALALLAKERGLDLDATPDTRPPGWAVTEKKQRREARERQRDGEEGKPRPVKRSQVDEVDLFLPVGRSRGVRPQDLVGAITNDAGIAGSTIGKVTILDHKSFVRVAREEAEQILRECPEVEIRGRMVPIKRARKRPPVKGGARTPRWSKKGKPSGRTKRGRWQRTK